MRALFAVGIRRSKALYRSYTTASETAGSPFGFIQRGDLDHISMLYRLYDELRYSVSPLDGNVVLRVEIDYGNLDFATIRAIDKARRVYDRQTSPVRQTASRLNESGIPFGNLHRDTGRYETPLKRRELYIFCCGKVEACIAWIGIGR